MKDGAIEVCRVLRTAGFETYLVGGCVRDMVLGRDPKDYDIATSARPDDVIKLFDRTVRVGEAFGVVLVRVHGDEYEVATFRADGTYHDGRRPSTVVYASAIEDVQRRDFTINALLLDPETGRIIDIVGGLADIGRKLIVAVGDPGLRFAEDRLRMLRAIRFSVQLEFDLDGPTFRAIAAAAHGQALSGVSPERITEELSKMWRSPDPGEAWRQLSNSGLLFAAMPYVTQWRRGGAMDRVTLEYQRRPDEYEDVLTADQREVLAWAVTLSDPGIPIKDAEDLLREHLRLPNSMIRRVVDILGMDGLADPTWVLGHEGVEALASDDQALYMAWQRVSLGLPTHPAKEAAAAVVRRLIDEPIAWDQVPDGNDFLGVGVPTGPRIGLLIKRAKHAIIDRRTKDKQEAIFIAMNEETI